MSPCKQYGVYCVTLVPRLLFFFIVTVSSLAYFSFSHRFIETNVETQRSRPALSKVEQIGRTLDPMGLLKFKCPLILFSLYALLGCLVTS